ncbi:glycosyltransferase [Flagellimonas lutaonensis]|uniref:Beta-(1,4)-galactosyltransferase, Family GT2 n=1 Tax=Flagellimonas lutaonensis TaxID=516051 RepID=A0A0D5YW16_9FLAO|nr:glycosyltransferase [Allomuricauda lutaonensis]AKA36069.1 Beta-(1,4)-galactosyltransferase, Family GT2 [Allomuricauda lutaonensis]
MRLSIILPTYNMEKYLSRCLDSLLAQDIPEEEYEIIIVNDESKDQTLAIAKEYQNKHSNIVICDKKNGGAGAARNSGLKLAKGKYIHFVDPDDYIAKNVYGTLLDFADKNELDITAFIFNKTKRTDWYETDTPPEKLNLEKVPIMTGTNYIANNNYRNTVWWYLINRNFFDSTGLAFIEGRWMEDSILTPQLFMKAKRMARLPLDVYRYMIVPNSAMTSKEPEHYHKLISDIENATFVFDGILKKIPENDAVSKKCKDRLHTRQQSFVFFLLVRLMKSGLPIQYIPEKLEGFKKINAYPLNNFIGEDFNGLSYRILTALFNQEKLMYPFMRFFRGVYRPAMKVIG